MQPATSAFSVLRITDFRNFILYRFFFTFGVNMMAVVVGWQVYEITKDAWSLGLVGLSEALPFLAMGLFGGNAADRFSRKTIIGISVAVYFVCVLCLVFLSTSGDFLIKTYHVIPIYVVIFFTGIVRGYLAPAQGAFAAQLVNKEMYIKSSTLNSIIWHLGAITGPAVGGLAYGFGGASSSYIVILAFIFFSGLAILNVTPKTLPPLINKESILVRIGEGIKYVFRHELLISALALDLFAVLFGGAVALLPVFADKVLHTGAEGLGYLRASPAIGSVLMSLVLVYYPPNKNSGKKLLWCVSGFGFCMILFALSPYYFLSFFLLFMSGMFDSVSVVIRSTIVQKFAPEHMRGRVEAVNRIFIGSSNEIGAFESGAAAKIMGLIPSVVFGGFMTLGVVIVAAIKGKGLRKLEL